MLCSDNIDIMGLRKFSLFLPIETPRVVHKKLAIGPSHLDNIRQLQDGPLRADIPAK